MSEHEIRIEVDEFSVEYAGCGSHRLLIRMKMSDESVIQWYDRLGRIVMRRPSVEQERRQEEERRAKEQRDRGLIA